MDKILNIFIRGYNRKHEMLDQAKIVRTFKKNNRS